MSYKPITDDQPLEIADDDGELDVVVHKERKATRKQLPLLIWVVLVTIIGGLIIYFGYQNAQDGNNIKKFIKSGNFTKINKTSTTCIIIKAYFEKTLKEDDDDQPKLVEIKEEQDETVKMEEIEEKQEFEEKNEEENDVDFEEMQKESEKLKEEIKKYNEHKNETKMEMVDKRFDKQLCGLGQYMSHIDRKCKDCDDNNCDECMHISGICYKCKNEYYINQYGKCMPKCEGYHDYNNLLLSEETKNQSIPICLGKNFSSQIFMTVQKSNNTHFVLPYIIIHPATSVTLLYHNNYPIVYYFNKDLFNFEEDLKLTDIVQEAEKRQQIVVVLGCHTLYDFSLFNNFLFQPALIIIETLVKARSTTFRAFFGQDYNAYGVIREYQAQYKNNTIDLVISDDPIEMAQYQLQQISEQLEYNLLVTHEQHYTDYNFESLQGAQSEKTTVILLFHTKNENDQHDYCQRFKYVSFLQCAIREIHIDHVQRMKQGLELISQFVVQPDL